MKNSSIRSILAVLVILGAASVKADVILQNTGGTLGTQTEYFGESFTTPSDFLYYNITFNFFSNIPATTPVAGGTAFILNQPYAGTPAGLSVTTPGFLAQSISATGGEYTFNPGFILATSSTYYLYENASITTSGGNTFPGGMAYFAPSSSSNFVPGGLQAANFTLSGTKIGLPLPEPSSQTALYVLASAVGLGFVVLRRRRMRA